MTVSPFHPDLIQLFDYVCQASVKVSVLIVFFLLVKTVLKNKISARLHYMLWLMVIVCLLLPWAPKSSLSLYNLAPFNAQQYSMLIGTKTSPISTDKTMRSPNPLKSASPQLTTAAISNKPGKSFNEVAFPYQGNILISVSTSTLIHRILAFIWIIGIAVFLFATLLINRRFTKSIQGQPVNEIKLCTALEEAKQRLNVKKVIPLIFTKKVTTPSLLGLFHPKLLIPVGYLDEFNTEQLNHIFVHELVHLKRKDVWVNWLTQGLLIVYWFNPILWFAFYKMREDQEIACDAKTLEHLELLTRRNMPTHSSN